MLVTTVMDRHVLPIASYNIPPKPISLQHGKAKAEPLPLYEASGTELGFTMKFTEAKLEAAFIDLLARVDMLSTQDGPRGSACCHPAKTDIFTAWKGLN